MKDTEFSKRHEFAYISGGWLPVNQNAKELTNQTVEGEVVVFQEITSRDISFHRCYFSLLNYIWSWLPDNFKISVPKEKFFVFLKHLKGEYEVLFEFQDGTKLVEYESISFGRMSQIAFKDYIKEQLPYIYTNIIGKFFKDEDYDMIIENIEHEYVKFFNKL